MEKEVAGADESQEKAPLGRFSRAQEPTTQERE